MIKTETRGLTNPVVVAACEFCGAFCSAEGGSVRHTRSCESGLKSEFWTPATVAAPVVEAAPAARDPPHDRRRPAPQHGRQRRGGGQVARRELSQPEELEPRDEPRRLSAATTLACVQTV